MSRKDKRTDYPKSVTCPYCQEKIEVFKYFKSFMIIATVFCMLGLLVLYKTGSVGFIPFGIGLFLIFSGIYQLKKGALENCNSCGSIVKLEFRKGLNGESKWISTIAEKNTVEEIPDYNKPTSTSDTIETESFHDGAVVGGNSFSLIFGDINLFLLNDAIEIEGLTDKGLSKKDRRLINLIFFIPTIVIGLILSIYVFGPLFKDVFAHLSNFKETSELIIAEWQKNMHPFIMVWNYFMFFWEFMLVFGSPFIIVGIVMNVCIEPFRRKYGIKVKTKFLLVDIIGGELYPTERKLELILKGPDNISQRINLMKLSPKIIKKLKEYLPDCVNGIG